MSSLRRRAAEARASELNPLQLAALAQQQAQEAQAAQQDADADRAPLGHRVAAAAQQPPGAARFSVLQVLL